MCMTTLAGVLATAVFLAAPGVRADETRMDRDAHASTDGATDLAVRADLAEILRLAQARNPELREAHERSRAARERATAAGRLPDLEAKYEQWAVPLRRPWDLGGADMLMLGLRQTFPAPGTLDARARGARAEAASVAESARGRSLDIAADVRRAYAEYALVEEEYRIHLEHAKLAHRVVELARSNYQTGRGAQQDVLRAVVELSRLHTDIAAIEQGRRSVQALLNALMAREPDAPLGPPAELVTPDATTDLAHMERLLAERRPELAAAARAVERSEAGVDGARLSARWPSFMVGADYMVMPMEESPHAYGAMVSINLPWLSGRRDDEVREAEHHLAADESALESVRNTARYELRDALARYRAARESLAIIDQDLLPQARQSYEAAQSGFASGQGDALGLLDSLRSFLFVRLERARALATLAQSYASLERAAGGPIPLPPAGAKEGEHRHE